MDKMGYLLAVVVAAIFVAVTIQSRLNCGDSRAERFKIRRNKVYKNTCRDGRRYDVWYTWQPDQVGRPGGMRFVRGTLCLSNGNAYIYPSLVLNVWLGWFLPSYGLSYRDIVQVHHDQVQHGWWQRVTNGRSWLRLTVTGGAELGIAFSCESEAEDVSVMFHAE